MQRLVKTIPCENGELFSTSNGQRIRLAGCRVALEIVEDSQDIPMLGGYKVRKYHIVVVLCRDMAFTRNIDVDFLKTVTAFDLLADVQRQDGMFESIPIRDLYPADIEIDGEWRFEVEGQPDLVRKLRGL